MDPLRQPAWRGLPGFLRVEISRCVEARRTLFCLDGAMGTEVPDGDCSGHRTRFAKACECDSRTSREHSTARKYHAGEFFLCGTWLERELPHLHGWRDSLPAADFRRYFHLVLGRADS